MKVIIGAHSINAIDAPALFSISIVTTDPEFTGVPPNNDFSILTLAQPVTFSDKVSPACLPSDVTQDYGGQEATIIGWGYTEDGRKPSVLQEANVTIITNEMCNSEWWQYQIEKYE